MLRKWRRQDFEQYIGLFILIPMQNGENSTVGLTRPLKLDYPHGQSVELWRWRRRRGWGTPRGPRPKAGGGGRTLPASSLSSMYSYISRNGSIGMSEHVHIVTYFMNRLSNNLNETGNVYIYLKRPLSHRKWGGRPPWSRDDFSIYLWKCKADAAKSQAVRLLRHPVHNSSCLTTRGRVILRTSNLYTKVCNTMHELVICFRFPVCNNNRRGRSINRDRSLHTRWEMKNWLV